MFNSPRSLLVLFVAVLMTTVLLVSARGSITSVTSYDDATPTRVIRAYDSMGRQDIGDNQVVTDMINAQAVTTAKIADEAVTVAKMEDLDDGKILVGNASDRPVEVAMSGDVTIVASGVTTVGALKIDAGKLAANAVTTAKILDANVTFAKLEAVAEGNILVGNVSGVATEVDASTSGQILVGDGTTVNSVAVSGDVTIATTGAITVANDAITSAKIDDDTIVFADISSSAHTDFFKVQLHEGAGLLNTTDAAAYAEADVLKGYLNTDDDTVVFYFVNDAAEVRVTTPAFASAVVP